MTVIFMCKGPEQKAGLEMVKQAMRSGAYRIFLFKDIDDAAGLRYQWDRACRDANVPRHKLYSTRHTFATTMLKEIL